MTDASPLIRTSVSAGIMEIKLCRPERKNALSQAMYEQLRVSIDRANEDPKVRVLLITGSEGCFSSGNDLADFAGAPDLQQADNAIVRFMTALADCPKPVVAAVEGVAVGIGTTLLLHCDLAYAHPDTHFRLPFVNLGLCPEFASSYLLPRLAGYAKAAEWLLLGEPFSAAEALEGRLINAVVESPLDTARAQAAKLAARPPRALRVSKALIKRHQRQAIDAAMHAELAEFVVALQGEECKEAIAAFFEKRAPRF